MPSYYLNIAWMFLIESEWTYDILMTFCLGLNVFRQRLETPINVNDLLSLKISQLPPGIARYILRTPFVDDLVICFRGRSLDTIERLLQQAVNAIQWSFFDGKSAKAVHELSS